MTSSPSVAALPLEAFRFRVEGMDCASCSAKIETAVRRILGVSGAKVSFATSTLMVDADPALVPARKIESTVSALGFQPTRIAPGAVPGRTGAHADDAGAHSHGASPRDVPWWRTGKARITAAAGILVIVAYGLSLLMPERASWVFIAATAIAALPIARRAFSAAFAGTPFSVEMLMVIAAAGAVVIGAAEEAAVVVFLFLVGELLEGYAAGRARASIRALADIVPKTALVEEGDAVREVDMATLAVGQRVRVRPGDRIAADGRIVAGASQVDEAPITGESVPKSKNEGDAVFAGSVNGDGVLSIVVEKTAADNTIARIIHLVEEAQEAKTPTERFIDRFSAWTSM